MASTSSTTENEPELTLAGRDRRKRSRVSLDFEESETDSEMSADEGEEFQAVVRSRGRGKGKRRGGSKGGVCRGGRRGRGRGKRTFKEKVFEEEEKNRLRRLQEERREKADNLIDKMTDEERKEMLKAVAARQPAVILDVAAVLSRRHQPDQPPSQPEPGTAPPSWCVCSHCPQMERDEDKLCCGMAPQYCYSLRPEMELVVTDPFTLHLQQTFRDDVLALQAQTEEDTNKSFRHASYRQYILCIYGRLEKDDRRVVPACCFKVIRYKFPSISGQYTGFIPARHGVGW